MKNIEECIREQVAAVIQEYLPRSTGQSPTRLGNKVYIRTVTHHYTGQIVALTESEIVLSDAAWIADSGRWATAFKTGELNEIEPYPDDVQVAVSRGAVCDVATWPHALPRAQK